MASNTSSAQQGHLTLSDAAKAAKYPLANLIPTDQDDALKALLKRHKISADEHETIRKIKGSSPTMAELGVFSAMWSEHCSYKSSRVHLKRFPTKGEQVVVGPGENAGVVRLEGHMCLAFKMESHNHPSYIEPYQGAATGVGGILRDVFCMGARPIANLNCLRFGERSHERTSYLVPRVVKGIGDYGNCIGIPTVGGSVSYDKSYNGNCLVNAMSVGLIRDDKIFKGYASGIGNLVVYVGSATGRDGIHGATMASDSFATQNNNEKTTVQVGDPFAEKLLLEATLEVLEKGLVVGIQDMGAAGLTSSSFEMAGRAGNGVYIDLDRVPLRAKGMTAYEILLSESQERMLMVIEPGKWSELETVLKKWQLANAVIGVVTDTGRMQISAHGLLEVDLPVTPLTDEAPLYQRPVAPKKPRDERREVSVSSELSNLQVRLDSDHPFAQRTLLKALQDTGSKAAIYEQYDRHIGAKSVLSSDHGGAAVMWIRSEETKNAPWLGVAISAGCNERRVKNNPEVGAADAVLKCARQIWAAGGNPLAITDCLNFGSAEDPNVMREFSDSVDGISRACRELRVPVVSGNVSLYNSTDGVSIYPTPMIGMVGRVDDVRKATPAIMVPNEDLDVYLVSPKDLSCEGQSFAASLAAKVAGMNPESGDLGEIHWSSERQVADGIQTLRSKGLLVAVREIGEGGTGLALIKMAMGLLRTGKSLEIKLHNGKEFFAEGGARYVLQFKRGCASLAVEASKELGLKCELIGRVTDDRKTQVTGYFGSISSIEILKAFDSSQLIGGLTK